MRRKQFLLLVLSLASLFGGLLYPPQAYAQAKTSAPLNFSHVFLIILENRSVENVIGNPALPQLNALAKKGALANNYHGVTHPSLPNYVALIAGQSFGTHSDNPSQTFDGPTLPDRLEAKKMTWKGYFQGLPKAGFKGATLGPDFVYAKKHNPFMLFPSIANTPVRATKTVPLSQLSADLKAGKAPDFAMIVPDLCNDLHGNPNCTDPAQLTKNADQFVSTWVKAIQKSSAWDNRAAIIITFDEAEGLDFRGGGGRIPFIALTKNGPQGFITEQSFNHYNLLKTLTDAWSLQPLGQTAEANNMNLLFVK